MFGGGAFSMHNDVLLAEPTGQADCERLVEEIKNRAKGSMKVGNYPEADALYTKAISVLPTAVLFANRSLARLSLSRAAEALEDADSAIASDASYAKGYYRKGMACMSLRNYDGAVAAFTQGLDLEPNDKSFQDQLAKATQAAAAEGGTSAQPHPRPTAEATSTSTEVKRSKKAETKRAEEPTVVERDETVRNTENLRGYKVLEDGRKTTYFNNELSEEAKALIGDIAPKKVDLTEAELAAAGTGSAWNYAGTWEEKNLTSWAKRRLEDMFRETEVELPAGGALVRIKTVTSVAGDAQITTARGKRKHIYDFTIELQWELEVDEAKAMGNIKLMDVNADGEYEVDVEVDRQSSPSTRILVDSYVRRSGDGLQAALIRKLGEFREEFLQK